MTPSGTPVGQVNTPSAVAVDPADNVYVAEYGGSSSLEGRVQKRDAAGNWTEIAAPGTNPGQVYAPMSLATDGMGNLYVSDLASGNNSVEGIGRIQKRDKRGTLDRAGHRRERSWTGSLPQGFGSGQCGQSLVSDTGGRTGRDGRKAGCRNGMLGELDRDRHGQARLQDRSMAPPSWRRTARATCT